MKTCKICMRHQSLDAFHISTKSKFGVDDRCKTCCAEKRKSYHRMNEDQLAQFRQDKARKKLDDLNALLLAGKKQCVKCLATLSLDNFSKTPYGLGFTLTCKTCKNTASKNAYSKNSEKICERTKKYQKENAEKCSQNAKKYYTKHKEKIVSRTSAYTKKRRKSDSVFMLATSIRRRINSFFRSKKFVKNKTTSQILGCSFHEFCTHIEKQFTKSMSWQMVMRGEIHIDHIVPLSTAKTEEDVISLNHFTNLRPLLAKDNLRKGKKVEFLL